MWSYIAPGYFRQMPWDPYMQWSRLYFLGSHWEDESGRWREGFFPKIKPTHLWTMDKHWQVRLEEIP